jgi:two-component system, chemotaxis family, chemotaxis protein CheY
VKNLTHAIGFVAALTYDVVIVEDDDVIREQLAAKFERDGLSVATAADGQAALDLLTRTPARVVIIDLMMPVMSGAELVDALKANPQLSRIPRLFITAARNVHLSPGSPVFVKPLNMPSLVRAVRTYASAPG